MRAIEILFDNPSFTKVPSVWLDPPYETRVVGQNKLLNRDEMFYASLGTFFFVSVCSRS